MCKRLKTLLNIFSILYLFFLLYLSSSDYHSSRATTISNLFLDSSFLSFFFFIYQNFFWKKYLYVLLSIMTWLFYLVLNVLEKISFIQIEFIYFPPSTIIFYFLSNIITFLKKTKDEKKTTTVSVKFKCCLRQFFPI